MIAEEQILEDKALQNALASQFLLRSPTDPLQKLHTRSWDRFCEIGLPTKANDVYRYLPLKQFYSNDYTAASVSEISKEQIIPFILPESQRSYLVFINGRFTPSLSCTDSIPNRVVISLLDQAISTYGTFLNNQWNKSLKEETDPFCLLNGALHQDGLYLYIPPKTIIEAPIQLLSIIDTRDEQMFIMPRVQGLVGAGSEFSLVSTCHLLSGVHFAVNAFVELSIEENSHVKYTQSVCNFNEKIYYFDALRSTLKRNASLKTYVITDGAAAVRHDYRVALIGDNAEANLNGLCKIRDKKEAHTHVLIDHQAPNCRSFQLFKAVLYDFSRSAFEGKILVRQAAQKTEAFQLNNNLLLSDRAHADSKPNLEIFADDVKASHGATVGPLDLESQFYLKTRGFSRTEAENLLVNSFCKEVMDMVPIESLQHLLSN